LINDFHLAPQSPCIDAGDPIEKLVSDYLAGETLLTVDAVTAIRPGDTIWITDGINTEADTVFATTDTTITITTGFANKYAAADGAWLFTLSSDFSPEPDPNGGRINMGAFGGTPNASPSEVACPTDLDGDGDVDRKDLSLFANQFGSTDCPACTADFNGDGSVDEADLAAFAGGFGISACP